MTRLIRVALRAVLGIFIVTWGVVLGGLFVAFGACVQSINGGGGGLFSTPLSAIMTILGISGGVSAVGVAVWLVIDGFRDPRNKDSPSC
jgi:hypothetical protein